MHSSNHMRLLRRFRRVTLGAVAIFLAGDCYNQNKTAGGTQVTGQKGGFGIDGPETLKYLNSLDFTIASVGDSLLVKKYLCTAPGNTCPADGVRLMFIPEAGAYKRDWESAMKKNNEGYVVATVLNVDDVTFPDLGLEPGKLAYAFVGQVGTTADERGFAIYRIDPLTGLKQATWSLTTDVKHCPNGAYRDKPAVKAMHPGPEPCTPITVAEASNGIAMAYAAVPRASTAFAAGLGQLWISCSGGCCEVKSETE